MEMGLSAIMHKLVEIQDSNKENKEEGVGAIQRIIEVVTKVGQTVKNPQIMVQPQMAKHQFMIPSWFQSSFGKFTSICTTKRQNNLMVENGSTNSSKKWRTPKSRVEPTQLCKVAESWDLEGAPDFQH